MNHLRNILDGFVSLLELQSDGGRNYVYGRDGFIVDKVNLRSDVRAVGHDVKIVVRRAQISSYGKQGTSSARHQ